MDAQTFIANFATVVGAPGGVQRLRELVLDLAVRGRLVQQDPADEPVEVLIDRIALEHPSFDRASVAAVAELPFDIPSTWRWLPLDRATHLEMGQSPPSSTYNQSGEGMPFFQGKADFGLTHPTVRYWCTTPTKVAQPCDVLISVRAPVGPSNIADRGCCIGRGLAAIRPLGGIAPKFLRYVIQAFEKDLAALGTGTTFGAISRKNLAPFRVPIPPLDEQERILAKVDELMGLCDQLEAGQEHCHRATIRFQGSGLRALTEADTSDDLRHAWERVSTSWPAFTSDPDSLNVLRHAILQLAISGALTGKDAIGGDGQFVGRDRDAPSGAFPLPEGWAWQEFGELCERITVGHVGPMSNRYVTSGIPFLRSQNVDWFRYDPTNLKYIDLEFHAELKKSALVGGEVISVRSGNVGRTCVFPIGGGTANCADLVIMRVGAHLDPHYAAIVMNSPYGVAHVSSRKVGIAQAHFNVGSAKRMRTPVPPIEVQRDLVRTVHQLLAACDGLESLLRHQSLRAERFAAAARRMTSVGN